MSQLASRPVRPRISLLITVCLIAPLLGQKDETAQPARRQDPVPQCACASLEAVEAAREAFELHSKRRLQEASEAYTEALQIVNPRDATESEKAQVLRFAPRLFVTPKEVFPLKDAAAVLHPGGEWIAYHLFWEDDIDFPDDNDPSDHEVIWVRLDTERRNVAGVYTYFHGRIVRSPAPESPRPRIAVQWGKHGSMPWDWRGIAVEPDESDGGQTNGHPFTLEDYNRITWQKLASIGRDAQGSPLGRGWPFKFEGTWEDFTRFTRAIDPAEWIRKRDFVKVSCLNNAVINRHFLRYNFAAKTEWPMDLCSR